MRNSLERFQMQKLAEDICSRLWSSDSPRDPTMATHFKIVSSKSLALCWSWPTLACILGPRSSLVIWRDCMFVHAVFESLEPTNWEGGLKTRDSGNHHLWAESSESSWVSSIIMSSWSSKVEQRNWTVLIFLSLTEEKSRLIIVTQKYFTSWKLQIEFLVWEGKTQNKSHPYKILWLLTRKCACCERVCEL